MFNFNKLVSVVLFIHCVILFILGNVDSTVSTPGVYNYKLGCLTFVTFLYMMIVVCNKTLTSVGGVPTSLLFGLSFICAGVKLLGSNNMTATADSTTATGSGSIIDKNENDGVKVLGGIASVVSILLGLVLTFSICKK